MFRLVFLIGIIFIYFYLIKDKDLVKKIESSFEIEKPKIKNSHSRIF